MNTPIIYIVSICRSDVILFKLTSVTRVITARVISNRMHVHTVSLEAPHSLARKEYRSFFRACQARHEQVYVIRENLCTHIYTQWGMIQCRTSSMQGTHAEACLAIFVGIDEGTAFELAPYAF